MIYLFVALRGDGFILIFVFACSHFDVCSSLFLSCFRLLNFATMDLFDVSSIARNIIIRSIPEGLRSSPAFSSFSMSALLHGMVKFLFRFPVDGKNLTPFHLGLLLAPEEAFSKMHNIRDMLQRLVTVLGNVFGDEGFYCSLFKDLLSVLGCVHHPV